MEYRNTKRDNEMYDRRSKHLKMPDTPLTEIILEKYEANEARIKEVAHELTSPKCIIKRLVIK